MGIGPGLLILVSGRGVLPVRRRLSSSCDLPSCLRIESPTKALPAQNLDLSNECFRLAELSGRFWPLSEEFSDNQDLQRWTELLYTLHRIPLFFTHA